MPYIRPSTLERQMAHLDALGSPTELYQKAFKQIQERVLNHIQQNIANMLTPEQRRDKRLHKIIAEQQSIDEGQAAITMRIYRVGTLNSPLNRKNIILNAKQQRLTGVMLLCKDVGNIVILEGGPRGLKKLDHMILSRLKYENTGNIGIHVLEKLQEQSANHDDMSDDGDAGNDNNDNNQDHNENNKESKKQLALPEFISTIDPTFGRSPHNDALLVWCGNFKQRYFEDFHIKKANSSFHLKNILKKFGLENVYDASIQYF